ncbi:MAG: HlyC/CorC family transporter [Chitinophagaceae bacterium]|nr:HlyC/CorC family transporter [Chitinophagaceae bacterium]
MSELYTVGFICITLLFVGFFSGLEIAFVSVNRLSIELKKKQGKKSGIILGKFMEQPAQFIGSCLVGVNIFLVAYGMLFSDLLHKSIWHPFHIQNPILKLVVDAVISTFVVLIFGEFLPKAIFKAKNESLLVFFSSIANFFYKLFQPLAAFFVDVSEWILKYLFNVNVKNKTEAFTHIDLEYFINQKNMEQSEDNPEHSKELLKNAMSLPTIKIRECLVPRTEIEAVDIKSSIEEIKQRFIETTLSKLLVYENSIDEIKGYIHQLDLYKKPKTLNEILLPIPVVPESMWAADLINKFTKEHKSIAWVVDEFGGTAGIITMEDLLEEIFGEIKDEHDVEEFVEKQISQTEFIFSGRLELDYLKENYNLSFLETAEAETLSGYIITNHEQIPQAKESIIISNYQFDILNVSDTRIEMVKMKILR